MMFFPYQGIAEDDKTSETKELVRMPSGRPVSLEMTCISAASGWPWPSTVHLQCPSDAVALQNGYHMK